MGLFDWLRQEPAEEPSGPVAHAPTSEDIENALRSAEQMTLKGQVPTAVLARVLRITTITRAILPRIENLGLDSQDAYTVVATATDYLPESIAGYLKLPRDWANSRPVANGKSSLLLLVDQLDLLCLTMSRMYDATNRQDAAALVAQGAFLEQKFGGRPASKVTMDPVRRKSDNPLDL